MGSSASLSDLGFGDAPAQATGTATHDLSDLGFGDSAPQAAPKSAAPAAPKPAPQQVDQPLHPAGLPDGVSLPGIPTRAPAPDMPMETFGRDPRPFAERATDSVKKAGSTLADIATRGPKTLYKGLSEVGAAAGTLGMAGYMSGPAVKPKEDATKQEVDQAIHQSAQGGLDTVSGGLQTEMMMALPGLAKLGAAADAGDVLAKQAIIKFVAGAEAGNISADASDALAKHAGLNDQQREAVNTIAMFLPTLAGRVLGAKGAVGTDPQGRTGMGGTVLDGKAGAGVYASPTEFRAGVKVGDTHVGVSIPRTPSPAEATAQSLLDEGIQTVRQAQQADAAAEQIVKGATPQQAVEDLKPKQAMPAAMQQGELSPAVVDTLSETIASLPEQDRPQAIMEAHGKLADWMAKQGKFVGPDGQITVVKTPEQAQQLAAKLINDQVGKHDEAQAAAAQPATKPTGKAAEGDDQLLQRAKTVLAANPETSNPVALLQRHLGIGGASAVELHRRATADGAATVGSKDERVVPERDETIDAQMDALRAGTIKAVMLPEGSKYEPKLEAGMKKVVVDGDAPGAGTYIIKGISPQTVKEAAKAGTHGDLLGHVQTKDELDGGLTAAVVARKADGTEIQLSEVNNPQAAQAQAEILAERHPGAKISIEPTDAAVSARIDQPGTAAAVAEPESGEMHDLGFEPDNGAANLTENQPNEPEAVQESRNEADNSAGNLTDIGFEEQKPESQKARSYTPGTALEGHDGRATNVKTAADEFPSLPGKYRLVEAEHLQPSHNAKSFEPNQAYPKGVQERDYEKEDGKHRVISQAQNLDPDYLLTDNPDPVNGPPVTLADGLVLGGNSRTMSIQRAYGDGAKGQFYKDALRDAADRFGLNASQVSKMRRPVLVREIANPKDLDEMERIGSALNKSKMATMGASEKAVSAGRKITPELMDEIARLVEKTGEGSSIRAMMADHGIDVLNKLIDGGVLTSQEAPALKEGKDRLSEAGKDFIERALLGAVIRDAQVLDKLTTLVPSILNKLDGSLAPITSLWAQEADYNLLPALRGALDLHAEVATRRSSVETFIKQTDMMNPRQVNPVVDAIALKLTERPLMVKKAFRSFADDAQDSRVGQGSLMGGNELAYESFNKWFGSNLTEKEYLLGIEGSVDQLGQPYTATDSGQHPAKAAETEGSGAEAEKPAEVATPFQPEKEDRVRYRTKDGEEKTGRYKAAFGENNVRIAPDGGGKPDVVSKKNLLGPASDSKISEKVENASNEVAKPETPAASEPKSQVKVDTLAERLYSEIAAGRMPKDNIALRKLAEQFDGKAADNARLKEAQEAMEEALVRRSREIVAEGGQTKATFDELLKLYESQPNLNIRTSTSVENQAYSTPAPLAFLAGKLAGVEGRRTVYEPTAGNGMLVIGANAEKVHANELNPERASALKRQGFHVTEQDAASSLPATVKPASVDAVITNPPFGSVKGADGKTTKTAVDGYKIGQIDHLIAARALEAMKDDGRATLILGANKVAGGQSSDDRIFFNWLYSHYNVVSHFELDGKLYNRQGAAWPVRVISVNARLRSDRFAPEAGEIQRVRSWKEVYERASQGMAASLERPSSLGDGSAVQKPGDASGPVPGTPAGTNPRVDRGKPAAGEKSLDRKPGSEPQPLPDSERESAAGLARTDDDVRPDADVSRSDRLAKGEDRKPAAKRDAGPAGAGRDDLAPPETAFQVTYTPASSKKDRDILIPTNMRDSLNHAMNVLQDRVGSLDEFAAKKLGYDDVEQLHDALMGLQIDSVAAAIDQIEQGKAIVIADQTGIGKGRQAAAIIRYAVKQDKVPIFFSVKPSLFTDMYGDLADIGTDDVRPFIVNVDEAISLPNKTTVFGNNPNRHRGVMEKVSTSGMLPEDRNAVFLTYSQINKENVQRDLLRAIAHKAIFVLDESHNAAGESATGDFVQEVLGQAHGVVFLSATYAKRPDNMPLYSRTNLGMAIQDKAKLEAAMAKGGVALQTVVSNNLVKDGQMFRRERSFDGVNFSEITATERSKEHRALADKVTEGLRAIVAADRLFHALTVPKLQKETKGEQVTGGGNKADVSVSHTEFSSVVHNSVRQLVLALKADEAAERAIAAIKRGEKPIIAVEMTMGSFLQEYAAENGIQEGQPLGTFDYRTVLHRALERSRAIQKKDKQGNVTKVPIPYSRLEDETRLAYHRAEAIIDGLDVNIPMSPIDWIRQRIKDAGHSIGEITGRNLAVDYSDRKVPKLTTVPSEELSTQGKVETARRFNNGGLDAILLNVAGSTGISLHASEKFQDQRKRRMIVAQPAQDINIFMQMLGRPHRTGQVKTPDYDLLALDLPAEKRPNALLSKKLKSLNANTSSNTESATSVKAADILNKYGDEIVAQYLAENMDLSRELGILRPLGEEGQVSDDIARTATGRLAIMPVAKQEEFYREVEQRYSTLIDYLNDTNQNELEPRTFDFEAQEKQSSVLAHGSVPKSAFGGDAIYGEYSIKAQSKPLSADDVKGLMAQSLDGKTPAAHTQALIDRLQQDYKGWFEKLDPVLPSTGTAAVAREAAINFIKGHYIGSTLEAVVNGDPFTAVVTNIESSHKGGGNPFSMSKIDVTLATTGSQSRLKVPATQLLRITTGKTHSNADTVFALHRPPARETAKIITGNLLSAYGELKDTKATIIHFTKEDGTVEQGILLPKSFELSENTMGDRLLEKPGDVERFLREYPKQDEMKLIGAASRDQDVRVVVGKGGGLQIVTHKSKARGAKYFLDRGITAVTGDFVSSGQMMKADVPRGKEKEAIAAVQKKAALYASASMKEAADRILASKPEPKKPTMGTTLHASVWGADLAAAALGRVVKRAWDADIAPHLPELGKNFKEAIDTAVNAIAPTINANRDVLDSLMKLKGDQERAMFHLDNAFAGIQKMFAQLPFEERIEFLDRFKTGKEQKTPELEKVAEMYRALDQRTYERIVDAQVGAMDAAARKVWAKLGTQEREAVFDELGDARQFERPGDRDLVRDKTAPMDERREARKRMVLQRIANGVLSFKQNHLRAFWKVIPGTLEEKTGRRGRKSPLRGDQGFRRRSTLPDVSSGIADGGVLETDNPQELIELGQKSSLRYITAMKMWTEVGDLGMRKFVPSGERAPDGWKRINDGIAKVFYPAHILTDPLSKMPDVIEKAELGVRETMVQGGEWYVEQSAARLLNNYLSTSWFQTNAVGRGLMAYKNITTGIELGLSPIHATFESIEAIGSQFGLGAMHAWNNGVRYGNGKAFLDGLKQAASAPAAPVTMAKLGGKAVQMERQGFEAFAADPANQQFLQRFPEAAHLVDLLFTGGITMAQPREYRVQMYDAMKAAWTDSNYLGAVLRAIPGGVEKIMNPMFEKWIPRLKMGFALQSLSSQLADAHDALVRGDVTEAEVARSVVNSVENRFGELNFSNLWWENTSKGAAQILFRSVTWKLGNWRGLATGVTGQAKSFADPLKTMRDDAKGYRKGSDRKAHEYIPKLDLNMSWLIGMVITTAVASAVLGRLLSGKEFWEWLPEDEKLGHSAAGALALELMHPRTGGVDAYTGLPGRLSLPTGLRDFEHAFRNPRTYLHGSESGFISKMLDTWDNRDFAGNYVYDPAGRWYQALAHILTYNAPLPIIAQTAFEGRRKHDYTKFAEGMVGLSPASTELDMSPLMRHMEEIRRRKKIPQTPEEQEEYREKAAAALDGGLSPKERRAELKKLHKPYLERLAKNLDYGELKDAMRLASPAEKEELHGALMRKRKDALAKGKQAAVARADRKSD